MSGYNNIDEMLSEANITETIDDTPIEESNADDTEHKSYIYMRVSSKDRTGKDMTVKEKQDFVRQLGIIKRSGVKYNAIFSEKITGGVKGENRQEFSKMLSILEEGDTVIFTETSRLGRNLVDSLSTIDTLTLEHKCNVQFLSNHISLRGGEKLDPYMWLVIVNCLTFDEFQRRQISYNVTNTLKAKKENGKKLGRPCRSQDKIDKVSELLYSGYTQTEVAAELGITQACVSQYKKIIYAE